MRRSVVRRTILGVLLLSSSFFLLPPVFAHHGAASLYDLKKQVTVKGTVTEFLWTNPHVELGVTPLESKNTTWLLELGSPPNIGNRGWTSKTVKYGDVITVTFNPSSHGLKTGLFIKGILANGTEMSR
jgi:Family of unknown function (DUF6152)